MNKHHKRSWNRFHLALIVLIIVASGAKGENEPICALHEPCVINHSCSCIVSASSAAGRSFYFDVTDFRKDQTYSCTLMSKPTGLMMDLGGSTFPKGSTVTCQNKDCVHFPVAFKVDTHDMIEQSSQAILKYFTPPSDIPHRIDVLCRPL